jgi:hypothetical protein
MDSKVGSNVFALIFVSCLTSGGHASFWNGLTTIAHATGTCAFISASQLRGAIGSARCAGS